MPDLEAELQLTSSRASFSQVLAHHIEASPDTQAQESQTCPPGKRQEISDPSCKNTAPSKKPCHAGPEITDIIEALVSPEESHTFTQNLSKLKVKTHPRKWAKRSLVIRTLTSEVCFSSWRPDGAPMIKRPITIEKFSSPLPVNDSSRPVTCTHPGCNRNFVDQSGLTKHLVVHGPKTFFCGLDGCSKSFADRTRLRRHQRGVHGQ